MPKAKSTLKQRLVFVKQLLKERNQRRLELNQTMVLLHANPDYKQLLGEIDCLTDILTDLKAKKQQKYTGGDQPNQPGLFHTIPPVITPKSKSGAG